MYRNTGNGRKALTQEAKAAREIIATAAAAAGFRLNPAAVYLVRVALVVPSWSHDLDGPLKSLLDAIFTTRWDHRVVRLEVDKLVESGQRYTEVEITEMPAPVRTGERAVAVRKSVPRTE